ncbi:hypothetical protein TNCV_1185021 [Trichonephila clavipes]|nr:hypothetical protein TNCV_1185021 [Trichonephila clavipes]
MYNNMYVCFGAPWIQRICVYGWQCPSSLCKHRKQMPSIAGCHSFGLPSILSGLESRRAYVRHTWLTNCSPSSTSYMSTGTLESIA